MPDLERRSSASFISSKEGGTPVSFRRSLMNRNSSNCLRVSIVVKSPYPCPPPRPGLSACPAIPSETQALETNHERTLYVPYVFCNHLISRQRSEVLSGGAAPLEAQAGSRRISQGEPAAAAGAKGLRITSARAAARFPSNEES